MSKMKEYKDNLSRFQFKVLARLSGNMTALTAKDLNELLAFKKSFVEYVKGEESRLGVESNVSVEEKKRNIYFTDISY